MTIDESPEMVSPEAAATQDEPSQDVSEPPRPTTVKGKGDEKKTDKLRVFLILLGVGLFFLVYFAPTPGPAIDPEGNAFALSHQGKAALALFFLRKNSDSDLMAYLRKSHDEGGTWGEEACVTTIPGYHVMNNDRVIQLSTGRLLAPVSHAPDWKRDGHFRNICFFSDDEGASWQPGTPPPIDETSPRTPTPTPASPSSAV